jgi:hypothetical protein
LLKHQAWGANPARQVAVGTVFEKDVRFALNDFQEPGQNNMLVEFQVDPGMRFLKESIAHDF